MEVLSVDLNITLPPYSSLFLSLLIDNESFAISALVEQREPITQYLSHVAHFFPDELFQLAAAKAKRKRKVVSVKKKRDELEELQRTDEKLVSLLQRI